MTNNTPLISIVMPVYNAARFLYPCLNSVLAQTYKNWELLVVDDGSTDDSKKIIQEFVAKEHRIQLITKANEGVSIARNVALETANGQFVYFIDADDIVSPNALEIMACAAVTYGATIVKADYQAIDEYDKPLFVNKKHLLRHKFAGKILNANDFDRKILMEEYFLWTCLFRMDVIRKYHIRFLPHCRLMEDADFIMNYLIYSERNIYIDALIYGYRKHIGAATSGRKDYNNDLKLIINHLYLMQELSYIKRLLCKIAISYYQEYSQMDKTYDLPPIKHGTILYQYAQKKLVFAHQIIDIYKFITRISILLRYRITMLLSIGR